MKKIKGKRFICNVDDVETWVLPWGKIKLLSEPNDDMTVAIVDCFPGTGHERHNHSGSPEVLFVLEGEGEQTIEVEGKIEKQKIKKGDLVTIPSEAFHSTINAGTAPLTLVAIYQINQNLVRDPGWKVEPPKNKSV